MRSVGSTDSLHSDEVGFTLRTRLNRGGRCLPVIYCWYRLVGKRETPPTPTQPTNFIGGQVPPTLLGTQRANNVGDTALLPLRSKSCLWRTQRNRGPPISLGARSRYVPTGPSRAFGAAAKSWRPLPTSNIELPVGRQA